MPFLGNTPANTFVSIAKQTITGNGGTSYSLSYPVTNANEIDVFYNNVRQEPTAAYSASGTTITFTEAIASTDSVYVIFNGQAIGTIDAPAGAYLPTSGGTVNGQLVVNQNNSSGTAAIRLPQDESTIQGPYANTAIRMGSNLVLRATGQASIDTAGTARIVVDSSGRVTMPYQPMFSGKLNGGSVPGSSARITTITADINIGNHWNAGVFTCPVAGKYVVSNTVMKNAGAGSVIHIDIYKNGSWLGNYRNRASDGDNYTQSSLTTIVNCAANDTLEFQWFGGCDALTTHDAFLIYLLS